MASFVFRLIFILPAVFLVSAFVPDPWSNHHRIDSQSKVQVSSSDESSSSSSSPTRTSGPNLSFSPRLVQSLDLAPLFEGVARHAATKRGKDAILRLVHLADENDQAAFGGTSRREAGLAATNTYSTKRNLLKQPSEPLPEPIAIISIAQSAAEARDEYELTRQASIALNTDSLRRTVADDGSDSGITLTLPPIYGGTSPWDTGALVNTDDDEWLALALAGYASSIDKEGILQADKVVHRLLDVRAWAHSNLTIEAAPGLAEIGKTISLNQLQTLHNEIRDTVELVQRRTIQDPSGSKSFSFRLSGDKFPALSLLRQKEDEILADLDNSMQQLLRNKSFASKIQSKPGERRKRSEAFDLDGRLVVSAPKRIASDIGVIRGYSRRGGTCYVEPKSIIHKGDELSQIREEIAEIENQIIQHQIALVAQAAPFIDRAMDTMARIDTIFARAAFGSTLNGVIPSIRAEGNVNVKDFVHPVLALKNYEDARQASSRNVVPIDLNLPADKGCRVLVISGTNGGGKTVALKSFGVVASMNKVGVPIPTNSQILMKKDKHGVPARVDFNRDILVEVGDEQDITKGESTLMARLNHMSTVIQRVTRTSQDDDMEATTEETNGTYPLILLDELGGGTDPDAGSALARAVLEKMMECNTARIVATTHSPQLKALSIHDDRFNCASVLLERTASTESGYKRPTFRLQYGIIGDSYALGAASRCEPALPHDVIERAAELMAGDDKENGDIFRAYATSLEREQEAARAATAEAEMLAEDIIRCRGANVALARAYVDHFIRLETRLENIFLDLKNDESRSAYDIVGDSLGEVRHVKRRVLTQADLLAQRGLKAVSGNYEFKEGESVVIIAEGEWDGQSATVTTCIDRALGGSEVAVIPSLDWGWTSADLDGAGSTSPLEQEVMVLKRSEVALWDYPSDSDWGLADDIPKTRNVSDSRQNLLDTISKLQTPEKDINGASSSQNGSVSSMFTSSRERKAANAAAKKEKQRAKKKGKKKKGSVYLANKPK